MKECRFKNDMGVKGAQKMNSIKYAGKADVPAIKALMDAAAAFAQKSWYVADDVEFLEKHISGAEGYTLKCMSDDCLAAFLVVRHPGLAEDNLGCYLQEVVGVQETCQKSDSLQGLESAQEQLMRVTHMESVAVNPAYRGRGLQKALLQRAEEIERQRGAEYLMATVHPDNVPSLQSFMQEGYECILETEKYGGLRRKVLCKRIKL